MKINVKQAVEQVHGLYRSAGNACTKRWKGKGRIWRLAHNYPFIKETSRTLDLAKIRDATSINIVTVLVATHIRP